MVVLRPPQERTSRIARCELEEKAKAVEIWSNARNDDRRSLPIADFRNALCQAPADERVGNGIHVFRCASGSLTRAAAEKQKERWDKEIGAPASRIKL